MAKYTIGIDFGTLSGRAVLVEVSTGAELAGAEFGYPHAVMDQTLPDGTPLGVDWALQHPQDYLDVLTRTIPAVLKQSGTDPADVIGIGIDFTASTFLPIQKDGTPLCFLPEFSGNPNAWVKLWKHHAAQDKANRINEIARSRNEPWLGRYGGKISSEWQVPKVWQVLDESPELYDAADYFVEAGDWIVYQLCGKLSKSACMAGYKGIWHKRDGYPSTEFYQALDPGLASFVQEKLHYPIAELGSCAGGLTAEMAEKLGLVEGTAVAAANVDAHVTMAAVKIEKAGVMLALIGTSTCHMLLSDVEQPVDGICGVVEGGIYPGYFGYEAGQSCVGDHFAWFIDNCLPASYYEDAKKQGKNIHAYLREKAQRLAVGESGLIALDWWNGNRSILVDVDLTGMIIGMTLQTKPEEIYRALIEATAFGTRKIIENYRQHGVPVEEFYASGGISQKDPMTMQIYADIIGLPIRIAGSTQGSALGSAIFAAVAAGNDNGGYDDVFRAARAMGKLRDEIYTPIAENQSMYDLLYAEYNALYEHFGRGGDAVMKRLKELKKAARNAGRPLSCEHEPNRSSGQHSVG